MPGLRPLSSPSPRHATSKAAARWKPSSGKGLAITDGRIAALGSEAECNRRRDPSNGHDKMEGPSHAPTPDRAARLPRGTRDGDGGPRSLGRPHGPHPRLSGAPCPDGPLHRPTASDGSGRNARDQPPERRDRASKKRRSLDPACQGAVMPLRRATHGAHVRGITLYCTGGGAAQRR